MLSDTSRRLFFASGVSLFCGCLSAVPTGDVSDAETTDRRTATPASKSDGPRTDDLYVHNRDGGSHRVSIRVERTEDRERVFEGEYDLPGLTRIRVPDVGEEGNSYDVSIAAGGERLVETWDVRTCEGTEAPKGNRDVEFRIEDGEIDAVENVCDAIFVEPRPATDHANYRVGEPETTVGDS